MLNQKLCRLEERCSTLESEKEQKEKDNLELNRKLTVLKTNISSLYKTAKSEIDRKSEQIRELQSQIDTLKFRRGKRVDERANRQQQSDHQPNLSYAPNPNLNYVLNHPANQAFNQSLSQPLYQPMNHTTNHFYR